MRINLNSNVVRYFLIKLNKPDLSKKENAN